MQRDRDRGAGVQVREAVGLKGGGDGDLELENAFVRAPALAPVRGCEGGDVQFGLD